MKHDPNCDVGCSLTGAANEHVLLCSRGFADQDAIRRETPSHSKPHEYFDYQHEMGRVACYS
jgi:hypothetical protein